MEPLKVLLLEGEDDRRRTVGRLLEAEGYAVTACGGRADALAAVGRETFDLALVDAGHRERGGLEVVGRLVGRNPGARVVLVVEPEAPRDIDWLHHDRVKILRRSADPAAARNYLALQAAGIRRDRRRRAEGRFRMLRGAVAALHRNFVFHALAVSLIASLGVVSAGKFYSDFVDGASPRRLQETGLDAGSLLSLYDEVRAMVEERRARDRRGR